MLHDAGFSGLPTSGWLGLAAVSVVSGLITGIAEALGALFAFSFCRVPVLGLKLTMDKMVRSWQSR